MRLYSESMIDETLELSTRTANALRESQIIFVRQLLEYTERGLLSLPNFGRKGLKEVEDELQRYGLCLGMQLPSCLPSIADRSFIEQDYT